ncbi:sialate O-acetylesterase [Mucilaginibacter sp. AW1-3]
MNKYFVLAVAVCCVLTSRAAIKLPALVGDHMVLQRDKPIKVWGYAKPAEAITINFAGKTYTTTTSSNGKWLVKMQAIKAGGPYQMVLTGENTITLNDILIGDVWICSGQSNMEFNLTQANNADQEVKNANYPLIRLFSVNKSIDLTPREDTWGNWSVCTSNSAQYFPAIGYFFARDVQRDIKIPIGLINASWGGTVIESWISKEGLIDEPTFGTKAQQVAAFDTAAYNKEHRKAHADWVTNFNSQDKGLADGQYVWAKETNVSDWKNINLPTIWDFTGLPDLWEMSGVVWFKKTVVLTPADIQASNQLSLGFVMNADEAFVNGTEVGRTGDKWGYKRLYTVPASLLREGENIITIRVENYGGDGGFADNAKYFYLKTAANTLSLAGEWKYKIGFNLTKFDRPEKEISPNTLPTLMYNTMISPLTNLSIKGVLWYQGEANWFRAYQYRELFPMMIADWRTKFNQGDFPFLYVQLAGYHRKQKQPETSSYWAEVREAQDKTLKVKNTGMVTAFDVGDSSNVHPKNKQEVARRLVLLAEKNVYGLPVKADAPRYRSFEIKDNAIIVKLSNPAGGLTAAKNVGGFAIAGEDHKFYWADAEILNDTQIKVSSLLVPHPVAVRYAWEDGPADANVYNSIHLPLFPFRTDTWKGLTDDNK